MKLTWLGHACFLLEHEGYRIVMDPYKGVPGYPPLKVSAHESSCSHQHGDHNATECVTLLPKRESPFAVRTIQTYHDERKGAERGKNAVRVFSADGVSVAHMGDLGHQLTPEQAAEIGSPDVILIPVGGFYTIDAKGAKAVCDALRPRCVVPMHYYHAPYGLPNVGKLDPFLKLWAESEIHYLDGASLEITPDLSGVYVPRFEA